MVSRRVSRSVRRLVGGLIVLAFLAAVAAPAQAAPDAWSAPTLTKGMVLEWIQDVLAELGLFAAEPEEAPREPGEPGVVFGKAGCEIDPSGAPCPESDIATQPLPPIE